MAAHRTSQSETRLLSGKNSAMITSKARRRPALAQHLAVETFLVSVVCLAYHI